MKNPIIIAIIAAVVAAVIGFIGGMQYQKMQAAGSASQLSQNSPAGQTGARRGGGGNLNGRGVRGQIVSVDATGITVKLPDGSTKIVLVSPTTAVMQETTVSQSDLVTGKEVLVLGATNSDGSVTAQTIQLNPQAMRFGGATGSGQSRNPLPAY